MVDTGKCKYKLTLKLILDTIGKYIYWVGTKTLKSWKLNIKENKEAFIEK